MLTNVTRRMMGLPEVKTTDTSIHPNGRGGSAYYRRVLAEKPNDANKGILGKRTRKLQARRQARDIAVQEANRKSKGANAEKAFRIPGSMTK